MGGCSVHKVPKKAERDVGSLHIGVRDGCKLSCGCRGSKTRSCGIPAIALNN